MSVEERLHRPRIDVLGPAQLTVGGQARPIRGRVARLLVGLVAADHALDLDHLTELVWPDVLPATHRAALHVHLGTLRRHLADAASGATIERVGDGYVLRLDGWEVDAVLAAHLATQARDRHGRDPAAARTRLEAALPLWRGEAFSVDGEVVDVVAAHHATAVRLDAEELLVECLLAEGLAGEAEAVAERLVAAEPLREVRWAQLLRARYLANRTADALATYRQARAVLIEELGLEPGRQLRELEAAILTDDRARLGVPAADEHVLPLPPARHGPLIGRDADLGRVVACIARAQPIVLLGPPGVGKTRLAVEATAARSEIAWIDVRDPAHGVAIRAIPEWARRHPEGLVIFDDAESDVDAVVRSVAGLRRHAPSVAVIVTSRVPLDVGARVEVLQPLELPDPSRTEDEIEAAAASRVLRAALVELAPNASISSVDLARLCGRAGGLPLVLRLYASAARALPVQSLLDRAVAVGDGDIDRSVGSVVDMLSLRSSSAFADLSVLRSSFDIAHGAQVAGLDETAFSDVLLELVDHGLVQAQPDRVLPYSMLEPIRDAAARSLRGTGRRRAVLDRHADACILRSRRFDELAAVGHDIADLLHHELPTVEEVLAHLVATADADRALELVCRLERPLYTLGWWSEKVALFDSALGIPGPITKMRARAHAFRSRAGPLHLLDPNHAALAESMASELGEVLLAAYARSLRAIWLWWSGDFERSIELSGSAAARFEAAGRTLEWSEARKFLGVAMVFAGETAGGLEIQQSTLATVRRTGAPFHVAHHLAYLGHCRRMLGDDAAALADLTEALEICRDVGNRGTAIHLCITLGELAVERGDAPGALALTAEALELIEAARGWTYEPWAWTVALRAHAHLGDLDAALTCGRRALARLARVPSGEGTRLAGELADVALRRGEPETAVRLMRVARESDDVRELPFRPRREVERFEDLDGRICAALGERPHGPPTGDQLSIAEAAGRLLIGPP